jgi:hypothetical protein
MMPLVQRDGTVKDVPGRKPFAYVLIIEQEATHYYLNVSAHDFLPEAEHALRTYAACHFVGLDDSDTAAALEELGIRARIYAIFERRSKQFSVELKPFARAMRGASEAA